MRTGCVDWGLRLMGRPTDPWRQHAPARPMTTSLEAASMTSRVTLVAERTTRPMGWCCFGVHMYMSDRGGGFQRGRWIVT